jgi:4-amino-4-deoxy-L-arabinose transferase-like glycosyltransferase
MNSCNYNCNDKLIQRIMVGFFIAWLMLHAAWRLLDHTPLRGDQTFYTLGAAHILETWDQSWPAFLSGLNDVTATRIRPPGGSLLLAPWLVFFDNDLRWAGLDTILWHTATLLLLFLLGKRLFDSTTGYLAGVFFLVLPLIYTTRVDPEFYFFTLLPLALLCCTHLWDENRMRWLWRLMVGLVVAFALLTKWVFAVYLLGPMFLLMVDLMLRIRRKTVSIRTSSFWIEMGLLTAPVLLVALLWYWPNRMALGAAFEQIARMRQFTPFHDGWSWSVPLHYPSQLLLHNKITPALFLLAGLCLPLLPSKILNRIGWRPFSPQEKYGYVLLLSSVIGALVYFSVRYENVPVKYAYALLPVLSILAVAWLKMIPIGRLKNCLIGLLVIYAACCSVWMHFAPLSLLGEAKLPRTVQIDPHNYLLRYTVPVSRPPHLQQWPMDAIAQTIERLERGNKQESQAAVLPDIYYFDWRNTNVALRLRGLDVEAVALPPKNGLLRLVNARYIITSRGQVTRFSYPHFEKNPNHRIAVPLNRIIDNAPAWFGDHYRMVGRFEMPYGLSELQLFRLDKPHNAISAEALCNFWISYHLNDVDAWDQVAKVWAMLLNQPRLNRAQSIRAILKDENQSNAANLSLDDLIQKHENLVSLLKKPHADSDILPYEKLQLGSLGADDGQALLESCASGKSLCAWRAAQLLGRRFLEQNDLERAEQRFLQAWRLQRDRPKILRQLAQIASQREQPDLEKLYNNIAKNSEALLNNNRRPLFYQKAANALLQAGMDQDALWYAYQGFTAGLNRYPNTMPLHRALQRTKQSLPDYETLMLPLERMTGDRSNDSAMAISLKTGDSYVFSFLNLDGGKYRLYWNHAIKDSSATISFSLDETMLQTRTYQNHEPGVFEFDSALWGDRLRIDCIEGETVLSDVYLQRIETDIPFVDWEGELNVKGKGYHAAKLDAVDGFSFITDGDWVRINFTKHTDPHAWDELIIQAQGLWTESAILTWMVKDDAKQDIEIETRQALLPAPGEEHVIVYLPDAVRKYHFLLGLRIHFEKLQPAGRRYVKSLNLIRKPITGE